VVLILGILTKWLAPKIAPNTGKEADEVAKHAKETADKARADLDAAKGRVTNPGTIVPTTAEDVNVGPTPINSANVTVGKVGPTHAAGEVQVDPMTGAQVAQPGSVTGIGGRIAGSGDDVVDAGLQNWQVERGGRGYQNQAAEAMAATLRGEGTSVARSLMQEAQDRAAKEQLSIAAGARGQSVASARRNAAINIGDQQIEAGGKMAELRAKEIADAAEGLAKVGGTIQGQSLQETTSKSTLNQQVELQNSQQRDTAIQAARERFAKGEITQAQLETDIAKADAEFKQRSGEKNIDVEKETKLAHAKEQLTADLATDDRLQNSFNLQAQLEAQARAGNQDAAVKLQALQAQIDVQVREFNAKQIQTANGQNIENRLRALQLDDTFVTNMTSAWHNAEARHDQVALAAIQAKLQQALGQASSNAAWQAGVVQQLGMISSLASGTVAPGGAIDMIQGGLKTREVNAAADHFDEGGTGITSDVRLKKGIQAVEGPDVDGFLRAVGKTQTWRYKDPAAEGKGAEGTKLGPMAQDMAKDKLGSGAVGQRPDGKLTLDYQHLAALAMAGLGRLNERVEAVEGKRKPAGKGPDEAGFLRQYGAR
jgi:hypothetical protein